MTEGGKTARSDIWGGAGWVGLGLLIVAGSLRMDRFESMGAQLYTMPGFVPGMIGGLVAALGLVLMLRGWLRRAADASAQAAEPLLNRRIVTTLVLTLMYAGLLIGRAPFWLVTALFVAAFVAVFMPPGATPARRALVAVAAGVLTSAIVTLVFQHVFLVRLP
jgi:hypothetical protein